MANIPTGTFPENGMPGGAIPGGGLSYGSAGLLVVQQFGYVSVGTNGTSKPLAAGLTGGRFAGGHYFVFAGYIPPALFVSEDGASWRDLSPAADHVIRAVAVGNGRLVAVGDRFLAERLIDDELT